MRILLQDLPEGHSIIQRGEPAEPLGLEEWIGDAGTIAVDLDLERRGARVTVRGKLEVRARRTCARCACPFDFEMTPEILVLAEQRGTDAPRDEVALEEDGEVLYHDGIELVLDAPIREAIILETPVVQVCRPDCRGLCPQCGQDLNVESCSCSPPEGDPRWGALKDLKDDE